MSPTETHFDEARVEAYRGAAYAGPASKKFWARVNAVKGTYGEAVYSEACKLQEAEARLLRILDDQDEARGDRTEDSMGKGSGYFCVEGHEVDENTSYCAACQTCVIATKREAAERTSNTYLEHFAKKHPRPEDGICGRCVGIAEMAAREARREEREACAREIDTPCGVDDDPKGMSCERRTPGGKVYHDPGCRRQDADDMRSSLVVAEDPVLRAALEAMFARIDEFREKMRQQVELPPAGDPFWTTPLGQAVRCEAEGGGDV